jgi:hypothetical protein
MLHVYGDSHATSLYFSKYAEIFFIEVNLTKMLYADGLVFGVNSSVRNQLMFTSLPSKHHEGLLMKPNLLAATPYSLFGNSDSENEI